MAKCDRNSPLTRKDVLKSRGRIRYQMSKGGQLAASSWPRRRGKKKTPQQQAWVDDFTNWAKIPNWTDACARAQADELADCTGFFWRDVITTAGHGKLYYEEGIGEHTSPLPLLWTESSPKQLYGAPRVTTPTAAVSRTTTQALGTDTYFTLTANTRLWDTNQFWSNTVNPNRLTVRANGLYIIMANVTITPAGTASCNMRFMKNGVTQLSFIRRPKTTSGTLTFEHMTLAYLLAGEFIQVQALNTAAGASGQLNMFAILAMTPEAIIP